MATVGKIKGYFMKPIRSDYGPRLNLEENVILSSREKGMMLIMTMIMMMMTEHLMVMKPH